MHIHVMPCVVCHVMSCGSQVGRQQHLLPSFPRIAWELTLAAARRGVRGAMLAVAHAYVTGEGIGEGVLEEAQPKLAVEWYEKALAARDWVAEAEAAEAAAVEEEVEEAMQATGGITASVSASAVHGAGGGHHHHHEHGHHHFGGADGRDGEQCMLELVYLYRRYGTTSDLRT